MAPGKKLHKLEDLPLKGKGIMRVDLDCPIGHARSCKMNPRSRLSFQYSCCHDAGARLVLASHLGSPDESWTRPFHDHNWERLAAILDRIYVRMMQSATARKVIMERLDGEIVLCRTRLL